MAGQTRRDVLTRQSPRDELVNVLEFEAEAERALAADAFRALAGSDRAAFDRITFRPRMMVNCLDLNLSVDLFGVSLFAPILVGPVADQRRFHVDGELATARGAAAAKAAMVVSSRSSHPLQDIAAQATSPLLFELPADQGAATLRTQVKAAETATCRAIVLTVGANEGGRRRPTRREWAAIDEVRNAGTLPVAVKGLMTAADATTAVSRGAQAVLISAYGHAEAAGQPAPLDAIAEVTAAVGPGIPVLVDGGFRRGSDVMKALALGARAVLVARPVMWGLAAYGADGVQSVIEMLQSELGRVMGCCGTPNLSAITSAAVKVHPAGPRYIP